MEKDCCGFQSRRGNRNLVRGENEDKFKQAETMHLHKDHRRALRADAARCSPLAVRNLPDAPIPPVRLPDG